jgi:hypothetical protein
VHKLYVKSHQDYLPGEKKVYGYTVPEVHVNHGKTIATLRRKEDGKFARACMKWIPEEYVNYLYSLYDANI